MDMWHAMTQREEGDAEGKAGGFKEWRVNGHGKRLNGGRRYGH